MGSNGFGLEEFLFKRIIFVLALILGVRVVVAVKPFSFTSHISFLLVVVVDVYLVVGKNVILVDVFNVAVVLTIPKDVVVMALLIGLVVVPFLVVMVVVVGAVVVVL